MRFEQTVVYETCVAKFQTVVISRTTHPITTWEGGKKRKKRSTSSIDPCVSHLPLHEGKISRDACTRAYEVFGQTASREPRRAEMQERSDRKQERNE